MNTKEEFISKLLQLQSIPYQMSDIFDINWLLNNGNDIKIIRGWGNNKENILKRIKVSLPEPLLLFLTEISIKQDIPYDLLIQLLIEKGLKDTFQENNKNEQ